MVNLVVNVIFTPDWIGYLISLIYAFIFVDFYFILLPPFFCFDMTLIIRAPVFNRLKLSLPLFVLVFILLPVSSRTLSFCLFSVFWGWRLDSLPLFCCIAPFRPVLLCSFTGMCNVSLDLTLFPKTLIVGNGKNWKVGPDFWDSPISLSKSTHSDLMKQIMVQCFQTP